MRAMFGHDEPLGLPRGSVRAILTLILALPVPVVVIMAMLGQSMNAQILGFYTVIVMLIVKDYFGTRTADTTVPVAKDEASSGAVDG